MLWIVGFLQSLSLLVQFDLALFSRLSSLVAIQVTAEDSFILPFNRNAYNAKVEEGVERCIVVASLESFLSPNN